MRRVLSALVTAVLAIDKPLERAFDRILRDSRLSGSQVGVVVVDVESGTTLYGRGQNMRLLPASNQKILTSTVALDVLGPDHRFTTVVAMDGEVRNGTLDGNLYLKGGGDPTLLAEDYAAFGRDVSAAGIQHVAGQIVADDTWFDDQRLGSGWEWNDEAYYYGAQISALTCAPDADYDAGSVIVSVSPGAVGAPPTVSVTPETGYVTIVNEAATVGPSGEARIYIDRELGSNVIRIWGAIPVDSVAQQEWIAVWEPTLYAADIFSRALESQGVGVSGGIVSGLTPDNVAELVSHESMPLSALLVPFLKISNNGHAEVLTKTVARKLYGQGTWSAGMTAIARYIGTAGVDTDAIRIVDGSGLSTANLISPEAIAKVLLATRNKPWFNTWYDALPIAGNTQRMVGGTLSSRLVNTTAANNVHAKTGSLNGVSTISGYLTDAGGREIVFSIMFNNYIGSAPTDLQDAMVLYLSQMTQPNLLGSWT